MSLLDSLAWKETAGNPTWAYTPPQTPLPEFAFDESEDDDDYWFWDKSPAEMFVDHVFMPLILLAVSALLILIICASIWGSFKLIALTLAMIA